MGESVRSARRRLVEVTVAELSRLYEVDRDAYDALMAVVAALADKRMRSR